MLSKGCIPKWREKGLEETVNEYQTNEYQKRLETGNDDPTVS